MDRITLFDIEINTLFEFAYNLFFVYSVSFSKRLMNKAKPDDIQLWRKSEYKLSLQCDPSEVEFDLSDADFTTRDLDSDLMLVMLVIGNEIVNFSNMEILCAHMPNALRHPRIFLMLRTENPFQINEMWIQIKLNKFRGLLSIELITYCPKITNEHQIWSFFHFLENMKISFPFGILQRDWVK